MERWLYVCVPVLQLSGGMLEPGGKGCLEEVVSVDVIEVQLVVVDRSHLCFCCLSLFDCFFILTWLVICFVSCSPQTVGFNLEEAEKLGRPFANVFFVGCVVFGMVLPVAVLPLVGSKTLSWRDSVAK